MRDLVVLRSLIDQLIIVSYVFLYSTYTHCRDYVPSCNHGWNPLRRQACVSADRAVFYSKNWLFQKVELS